MVVPSTAIFVTRVFSIIVCLLLGLPTCFRVNFSSAQRLVDSNRRAPLQDIVTWDNYSLSVRGERILFYSGEFHPFRLPVPSLWIDIFQKIKALGYSGVSFYVDWALVEGQPGTFRADGVFDLAPFFAAAQEAGIYLLARPGFYINAEVSGGGFPGWLQRIKGHLRTNDSDFLAATETYASNINKLIAQAQITNGGPVILYQPENEYTYPGSFDIVFPNGEYMAYVEKQARDAGIVVPFINNDAAPLGFFAPGKGAGSVDIYGHDSYPLGFDCQNPLDWPDNVLSTNFRSLHEQQSPLTPYSIVEFQGGSFDPWGGAGFQKCLQLVDADFERVFYKNLFSFGVTIINYYMTYGGTNWGNLGHPGGYTSYDYGACISEDTFTLRTKYQEAKVLANMLKAYGDAYLTATPGQGAAGNFVNTDAIYVTPLYGSVEKKTNFYVIRHSTYNTLNSTDFQITVSTSVGRLTIPQQGTSPASLTLNGRDSKIYVTDFDLGNGGTLVYSSTEIFTWQEDPSQTRTILVLFGGDEEVNEFAIKSPVGSVSVQGTVTVKDHGSHTTVQFTAIPGVEQTVFFDCPRLLVYLLSRSDVYDWWTLELEAPAPIGNFTSPSKSQVIVAGGALMRTARVQGSSLYLTGDLHPGSSPHLSTAVWPIRIIAGISQPCTVYLNGQKLPSAVSTSDGPFLVTTTANATFIKDQLVLPILGSGLSQWKSLDSLPEVSDPEYDDSRWTECNQSSSNNPLPLTTPYSLYASDYGFHAGSILYRGYFTSSAQGSGGSANLTLATQGGSGYGYSVWLNSHLIHSYPGTAAAGSANETIALPNLTPSTAYTLTVAIDHMGLTENFLVGSDTMKEPRGILSYNLTTTSGDGSYSQSAIRWKITGNLGGESAHYDLSRGPLNEGGFYAERQGYHLPGAPTSNSKEGGWTSEPLADALTHGPGTVKFYVTHFTLTTQRDDHAYSLVLRLPSVNISSSSNGGGGGGSNSNNNSSRPLSFRAVLYVNGWQFGKFVNHIGPQTAFPVPEGILDFHGGGLNTLGILVWNMESADNDGNSSSKKVKWEGVGWRLQAEVQTGRPRVQLSPADVWSQRKGAY